MEPGPAEVGIYRTEAAVVAEEYVEGLEAVSEKVEVDLWVLQGL